MLAVTVGAARGHRIATLRRRAVQAPAMRARLGFVAGAAIDPLKFFRMPPAPGLGEIRVAVHAGRTCVNGFRDGVRGDEYRDLLVTAVAGEVRPGVTAEASLIVLGWCGARRQQEDRGDGDEPALPMATVEEPRKG